MSEFCANIGCFCHQNAMRESFERQQREQEAQETKEEDK